MKMNFKYFLLIFLAMALINFYFGWEAKQIFHPTAKVISSKIEKEFPDAQSSKTQSNNNYYSPDKLKKVLISENIDQIYKALNDIKFMNYTGEILPFIKDLWELDLNNHSTIPIEIITKPIVRLHIADILIQAFNNRKVEVDTNELHKYVSSLLFSSDVDVKFSAILILRSFEKNADVDKIANFAKEEKYFKVSIDSLGNMCNPLAKKKLKELYGKFKNPESKDFIQEAIEEQKDFSKYHCNRNILKNKK